MVVKSPKLKPCWLSTLRYTILVSLLLAASSYTDSPNRSNRSAPHIAAANRHPLRHRSSTESTCTSPHTRSQAKEADNTIYHEATDSSAAKEESRFRLTHKEIAAYPQVVAGRASHPPASCTKDRHTAGKYPEPHPLLKNDHTNLPLLYKCRKRQITSASPQPQENPVPHLQSALVYTETNMQGYKTRAPADSVRFPPDTETHSPATQIPEILEQHWRNPLDPPQLNAPTPPHRLRPSSTRRSLRLQLRDQIFGDPVQISTASMGDATFLACFGSEEMDVETPSQSLQKLLVSKGKEKSGGKRPRDKGNASTPDPVHSSDPVQAIPRSFWMGFKVMERLAEENGQEPLFCDETTEDRVTRGIPRTEAMELEKVKVSFPRIPQLWYPNVRADGVPGQHYNLTQWPFEIPTDPTTCLALDFQISIHFQLPKTPLLHNHVKELVKKRLELMHIPLGTSLIKHVSILCMSVKRGGEKGVWAGIIKLHLLKPETDGIAMLKGLRPFILQLDPLPKVGTLGKVCKSYHAIARNNNLSIKITSDTLVGISPNALFCDVVESSFRRGHEFEVVDVQKSTPLNYAYIVAPTPLQAKKMQDLQVTTHHEILEGQMKKGPSLSLEQKQRKEALTLTLYNLPILMCIDTTTLEICKILGTKNVVSIWFHK